MQNHCQDTTVYLSIHLPKDILIASRFWQVWMKQLYISVCRFFFFFLFFLFFFRVMPAAYGSSQARGRIGATAAGHSHSNARSEFRLWPPPQLLAAQHTELLHHSPGIEWTCILMDTSQACCRCHSGNYGWRFLCGHKFSTHLGKYQGAQLLGCMVNVIRVCLVL